MKKAIQIDNLYKEYRLGVIGHGTLYRDLQSWWSKIRNKPDPNSILGSGNSKTIQDRVLAINNINLEIASGEIVGVIGHNGAGKSTLLKILSKVTAPSSGTIKYRGRVASLLEVGTGFHYELTGRENIYLNGAINGMNKKEITKKLDEIIHFAGVEKYVDTPVKRYSSGMHVRLGFAVAAHLDPEILVVDEVLAVGDAAFQKKAIDKMKDVSSDEGRTVLFVSHNMESIKKLCPRSVLLESGSIIEDGATADVINKYLIGQIDKTVSEKVFSNESSTNQSKGVMPGDELARPKSLSLKNSKGNLSSNFSELEDIFIEFICDILRDSNSAEIQFYLYNEKNIHVLLSRDNSRDSSDRSINKGKYIFKTKIPSNLLNDGVYSILVIITENNTIHIRENNCVSFQIEDTLKSDGSRGKFSAKWPEAVVRPKLNWTSERA